MEAIDIYLGESQEGEVEEHFDTHTLYSLDLEQFGVEGELQKFAGCCGNAVWCGIPYDLEEIKETTEYLSRMLTTNNESEYGFGAVFCTVTTDDQIKWLQECGWELLCDHTNYGTGNTIYTLRLL